MDVLCCRITVGDPDPDNPMKILNGVEMTEVHTIEINESYKKLIGTAKVTFPKGSVCRSTIIGNVTLEGKDVSRLTTEIMEDGVLIEKRTTQRLVDETTFKIGQRINIMLGHNGLETRDLPDRVYYYSTEYARKFKIDVHFQRHIEKPNCRTTIICSHGRSPQRLECHFQSQL